MARSPGARHSCLNGARTCQFHLNTGHISIDGLYQIGDILATVTDILQPRSFEEPERYGFADPPTKKLN
jgi:hypothetical protein